MSNMILVIGESASGKSYSLRNLNPDETFIINVLDKPLPFRGSRTKYQQREGGNYRAIDCHKAIINTAENVAKREGIKNIVIDDFQYIMANDFMARSIDEVYNKEKNPSFKKDTFEKFTIIQAEAHRVLLFLSRIPKDVNIIILSHSCVDDDGFSKMLTLGKMLDTKVKLAGMFTFIFHAYKEFGDPENGIESKYYFLTQLTDRFLAKSPPEIFDYKIDNDLNEVCKKIEEYNYYE